MSERALALVAHDAKKTLLVEWVGRHLPLFQRSAIYATGTTGSKIRAAWPDLNINRLKSGPLGGDQQIGAMIAEGHLDALFFFVDPMTALPHDVDVKALTRLATVYDLPMACSPATADCLAAALERDDEVIPYRGHTLD